MTKLVARADGFAELVAVPSENVFAVPSDASLNDLSLTEPTAVAFHAVKIAEQTSLTNVQDSKILIIGGGAIGLLLALVLKEKNAERITITDTNKKDWMFVKKLHHVR